MKKIHYSIFIVMIFILLTAFECNERVNTAETKQQAQTDQILNEMNRQIGIPNIVNFTQKKTLKDIYELCDQENLICYAYLFNEIEGKIGQFIGKCQGYGIPYSAQYTNPNKIIDPDQIGSYATGEGTPVVIPQADPNGLYMPTSSSATWLLLYDKENKPRPVYIEPTIIVSPFPLH